MESLGLTDSCVKNCGHFEIEKLAQFYFVMGSRPHRFVLACGILWTTSTKKKKKKKRVLQLKRFFRNRGGGG